jgi:predicted SAM-dependent methyltransferase
MWYIFVMEESSSISNFNLSLNLGCGKNKKKDFINIDIEERFEPDLNIDLSKEFPFKPDSCQYIYGEHFIEHLDWLEGRNLIRDCLSALHVGGTLRLVFPDFKKIFLAYTDNDTHFFEPFFRQLNESDYYYYKRVLMSPQEVRKEKVEFPRPDWHFSSKIDRNSRLQKRVRYYKHSIEIVDWFVHQYGEHKVVYDANSMVELLLELGFVRAYVSEFKPDIDSDAYIIESCCYVEGIK